MLSVAYWEADGTRLLNLEIRTTKTLHAAV
jgi:hypothetical protein